MAVAQVARSRHLSVVSSSGQSLYGLDTTEAAMFVRKRTRTRARRRVFDQDADGVSVYYQVLQSIRVDGKPRHRVIASWRGRRSLGQEIAARLRFQSRIEAQEAAGDATQSQRSRSFLAVLKGTCGPIPARKRLPRGFENGA